jgi:hypothetical protein
MSAIAYGIPFNLNLPGWLAVGGGSRVAKVRVTTATLTDGTVAVTDEAITANSQIYVGAVTPAGTPGALYVASKTAGAGYTITSTSATDTSVVGVTVVDLV